MRECEEGNSLRGAYFMGLIILPWDHPCPREAAALVAWEARVGKDTVVVTL